MRGFSYLKLVYKFIQPQSDFESLNVCGYMIILRQASGLSICLAVYRVDRTATQKLELAMFNNYSSSPNGL